MISMYTFSKVAKLTAFPSPNYIITHPQQQAVHKQPRQQPALKPSLLLSLTTTTSREGTEWVWISTSTSTLVWSMITTGAGVAGGFSVGSTYWLIMN
jgi:hypothetical protein